MDAAAFLRDLILIVVAYLSGSIPVGVIVARISGGPDPRTVGDRRVPSGSESVSWIQKTVFASRPDHQAGPADNGRQAR